MSAPSAGPLVRILERFPDARQSGENWSAKCPAHEDRRESLSLKEGRDGQALIHCFAGCATEAVLSALGLEMRDLFPDHPAGGNGRFQIVAEYPYTDEAGELLFQAVRLHPKDFRQRRPDGRGGWEWKLGNARRVLFRLPELISAENALSVFIPEGEKDVLNLVHLGLVATTNPMGAGKWRPEFNETLRSRRVVILPDNDPPDPKTGIRPGYEHGQQVARALHGVAASVKVLDLPGLPEKGDVSDWLHAGGTREELERLADAAPEWTRPRKAATRKPENPATPEDQEREGAPDTAPETVRHLTDLGNAERLVSRHGRDLHYLHPWRAWFVWNGRCWEKDDTAAVLRHAKDSVRTIYTEASGEMFEGDRKALAQHALRSESERAIHAMLGLAQSELGIPILPDDLDRDPWLLACANGTVDLRTGTLRESKREDLITKGVPVAYDPRALCPRWERFLMEIMPDPETVEFLQRAIGYSLTGETREQCFFILYGSGSNGKSVFMETILALLGEYGLRTPTETLLAKRGDSIPNDVAALKGARFVTASETEEGRRLSEALVKELTGQDTVSARFMRGEWFTFRPVCKLWLRTNHRPVIRGTDDAIWRRIRLIPFEQSFPEGNPRRDPHLLVTLQEELPGILAWAVEGAAAWQEKGLGPPEKVKTATGTYRAEMDSLADFLEDEIEADPAGKVTAGDLFERYFQWCTKAGEKPMSKRGLALRLKERGFTQERTGEARYWRGLWLRGSIG